MIKAVEAMFERCDECYSYVLGWYGVGLKFIVSSYDSVYLFVEQK